MRKTLKLLQVEDSDSDAELVVRQLSRSGYVADTTRVHNASELRYALETAEWDLIICEYRLPGFDAPGALETVRESGKDIPFLVVSGTIGEDLAVQLMKAGANDYLMKDNLTRLGAAVDRELREAESRAERRNALEELKVSQAQLALAIGSTELGIFDWNLVTGELFLSEFARQHLQFPENTTPTLENLLEAVHPEDRPRVARGTRDAMRPDSDGRFAEQYRAKIPLEGGDRWISGSGKVTFDENRRPIRFVGVTQDVTARKQAEQELQFQLHLIARITEQSTDCILLSDHEGKVRFVNPEAQRVFGYSAAEFMATAPHDLLHRHQGDHDCLLARQMSSGETLRDYEAVFHHKNGTPIEFSLSCAALEMNGSRIGMVFTLREITERKRAEAALRQSDQRFRRLFEADIIGIMIADEQHVLEANDKFLAFIGFSREELTAKRIECDGIAAPEYLEIRQKANVLLHESGMCPAFEMEYVRRDGTRVPVLYTAVELNRSSDFRVLGFAVDLSERKNLENQFRQAQKLESIGQLAGGIAHDFNNLLTVIMGYSNSLLANIDKNHPNRHAVQQIAAAADSAAALTRQLLTFSRRNSGEPRVVLIDSLVGRAESMLRRILGEQVEIFIRQGASGGHILADPSLIEQVILNLALNARDAMPDGGMLLIETSLIDEADEFAARCLSLPHGSYVSLSVTDTGEGMTAEVRARLFEPFFTTKPPGKGTGLGLSTVYGIVQQSGGSIDVHSAPGLGTTFRVLLPTVASEPVKEANTDRGPMRGGKETVLLVEDEPGVRSFVRDVLEAHQYTVLDAPNGQQAIDLVKHFDRPIHLLLSDVVLPGISGIEVIRQFRELRPGVPVMWMSGYPERHGAHLDPSIPFLQKPFRPEVLLARIREIFDSAPA